MKHYPSNLTEEELILQPNIKISDLNKRIKLLHELSKTVVSFNDHISTVSIEVTFSQEKINRLFSEANTVGTKFKHAGQDVKCIGKLSNFPKDDFRIQAFLNPNKSSNTLVADNNRGLAAHVIAEEPISRLKFVGIKEANNEKAFQKRKSDGKKVTFDKNSVPDKSNTIEIGEGGFKWTRTPSQLIVDNIKKIKEQLEN